MSVGKSTAVVNVHVESETVKARIPSDFIGFGYETSIIAVPNYFGPANATLVQLYRNLGAHGLIRIGGNVSDHTQYVPEGVAVVSPETGVTVINESGLKDFAEFARVVGWKVMWGLNLGTGTKEEAVEEAIAVDRHLGIQLQSLEIGNEVDLRGKYTTPFSDFAGYHSYYIDYKKAIRTALPRAVFSGPDVYVNMEILKAFAETEAKDIELLTYHYYRTAKHKPEATMENLLRTQENWVSRLTQLSQISRDSGRPYRINEINSFSGGGKLGISDTFASALWCLDNMFLLASYGCSGVNMETDINQFTWISHYSPIKRDPAMRCYATPEYYGMLAFSMAGRGDLLNVRLEKGDCNVTAYATRESNGALWVTIINKDLSTDAQLAVETSTRYSSAEAFRLKAPAVDSTEHVTLAGAEVSPDGSWLPKVSERMPVKQGVAQLSVPRASAVLLRFGD